MMEHARKPLSCILCQGDHKIWKCDKFIGMAVKERREFAVEKGLCFNCLLAGHRVSQCKLRIICPQCNRRHNTLLHYDNSVEESFRNECSKAGESDDAVQICAAGICQEAKVNRQSFLKVVSG